MFFICKLVCSNFICAATISVMKNASNITDTSLLKSRYKLDTLYRESNNILQTHQKYQ